MCKEVNRILLTGLRLRQTKSGNLGIVYSKFARCCFCNSYNYDILKWKFVFLKKNISFFPCWETKLGSAKLKSWQENKILIKCDTVVAYFIVYFIYSVIRSRVDGVWETFSLHTTLLFCAPQFSFVIKSECWAWSPEASSYPVSFFFFIFDFYYLLLAFKVWKTFGWQQSFTTRKSTSDKDDWRGLYSVVVISVPLAARLYLLMKMEYCWSTYDVVSKV